MRWIAPVCLTPLILAATVALGNGAEGAVTGYDNSEPPLEQAVEHPAEVTIHGSVTSSSGARLEGAAVSLAENTTGATNRVFSGAMGMFRVTGLEAGIYQIHAELTGFETASIPLVLEPGRSQQVHITLQQAFTIENQITVIGSAPASSLEFAEIRESLARDLGEALTKKAGVWQVRKGGIANDVVLRGFQGRDLNILIDGQRIYGACPNNMDPAAFHADFAEVDRVDIAKGPFDIKNEGGIGGTINVVTQRPPRNWHARGNLAAGSFGFFNPSATMSYGGDRVAALGGFSYRISDPYNDGSGKRFTELTNYKNDALNQRAFDIGTFWGKVGLTPSSKHRFQLSYARQEAENVLYPYLKMDADFDDTDRFGFRWEAQNPTDSIMGFMVQAYYTQVSHWMTDKFRTSSADTIRGYSMGTMADTRTLGSKAELQFRDWTFGFEAYQRFWGAFTEMVKMNYRPQFSLPDVNMTGLGFYGEYLKPLSERLTLTTGARLDQIRSEADESKANIGLYWAYHNTQLTSASDISPSGHARLDYTARPGIHLALGIGTSVQVPEPSERFFALKRKESDWVGNPLLRPSRNTGIDGTLSLEQQGSLIETTFFINWVDNFVTLYDQARLHDVPGVNNSQARTYTNTDARLWGTELNLVFPLQDHLFFSGDLSYIRGTKDPIAELGILSPNLAEIPPLRGRINLRFDYDYFFAAMEAVCSATQNRIDSDLSEETTSSYAILNVSIGVRRGRFGITAGIGNLLNRTFSEHLSYQRDPFRSGIRLTEPGRNVFVNVGLDF